MTHRFTLILLFVQATLLTVLIAQPSSNGQVLASSIPREIEPRGEITDVEAFVTVLEPVAQMERRFIKDRQRDGIEKAKAEGVYRGGIRRIDRRQVMTVHADGESPSAIASTLGCSRMQVYRILNEP